ncbi:hypothetical protein TeGR_g3434 [Tetraparma gracilis]|uniref:Tyrosinase copper-binding domain-containing protein n=1 Tax=Tetraparma gracilis TaxID=2962635 RepID=A0ABQ6N7K7_9STRA|nr:hypothetical protein TeGR_g3434 [Tetraparma gracilis]
MKLEHTALLLLSLPAASLASGSCTNPSEKLPMCSSAPPPSQRLRKEVNDLSSFEWDAVVEAIWTTKNTTLADGRERYGDTYKTYDYFVLQDSRGDQGHFSDAFITFHAALLLSFEQNLRLVDPDVALPYWAAQANGDIYTEDLVGSVPGTGEGNTVVDGAFANWPVTTDMDWESDWAGYIQDVEGATNGYSGGGTPGSMRGADNFLSASTLTRFGSPWSYSIDLQDKCLAESCWAEWYGDCIEGEFHSGAHTGIGGDGSGGAEGDFKDVVTSPNDPVFWFHHANIDRNRMLWTAGKGEEDKAAFYGYGGALDKDACQMKGYCPAGGIELTDTISALWPFDAAADLGVETVGEGGRWAVHADVICALAPDTAAYAYQEPQQIS